MQPVAGLQHMLLTAGGELHPALKQTFYALIIAQVLQNARGCGIIYLHSKREDLQMTAFVELPFDLLELVPAGVFLLLALALPFLFYHIAGGFLRRLEKHMPEWLRILTQSYLKPLAWAMRQALLFSAVVLLPIVQQHPAAANLLNTCSTLLSIYFLGLGAWRSAPMCRLLLRSAQNHLDLETNQTMARFFENLFRVLVGVFAGIAMLDTLGVPVSGLLTGAGVAGIAVSLAAQSTLSNLIAGVALVLEHPFGIGDYIVLGDLEGTVEDISFRSTKFRTLDNIMVSIENSKVASEYIRNCDQRQSRLWDFNIGVTYDTPRETLEQLCRDLTALVQQDPDVLGDKVSVTVDNFNAYSIDLRCRVYVTKVSLAGFLQVKNRLNLQIMDVVHKDGCDFAFPTTTLDIPAKQ